MGLKEYLVEKGKEKLKISVMQFRKGWDDMKAYQQFCELTMNFGINEKNIELMLCMKKWFKKRFDDISRRVEKAPKTFSYQLGCRIKYHVLKLNGKLDSLVYGTTVFNF